jgi:hypothetical protein
MRKRLFVEFRVLNTAKLQMVKRWHPIRSDPGACSLVMERGEGCALDYWNRRSSFVWNL